MILSVVSNMPVLLSGAFVILNNNRSVLLPRRLSTFEEESESESEEENEFGSMSTGLKSKHDLLVVDDKVSNIQSKQLDFGEKL